MIDISIPNYNFTLKKPSANFKLKITFRWIDASGEDDWYAITADVINNVVSNKKLVNGTNGSTSTKKFSILLPDVQKITSSTRMTLYLKYNNGVVYMPAFIGQKTYNYINYDPNETYFIESVAYSSDIPTIPTDLINETTLENTLNDYALKTDIKELPTDLINETTLENTLNDYALKASIPTDYINSSTLENTLNDYALKADIKELPTDLINETTLENTLNDYATKTQLTTIDNKFDNYTTTSDLSKNYTLKASIPTDYVNSSSLTTKLNDYALKAEINNIDLTDYRKLDDLKLSSTKHISFERESSTVYETGPFRNYVYMKGFFIDSSQNEVKFDFQYEKFNTSSENNWRCNPYISGPDNLALLVVIWFHDVKTDKYTLKFHLTTDRPFTLEDIYYVDEIALKADIPTDYVNSSSLTNTLNDYALKTDMPTDYVNSSSLTNTLNDYVLKTDIPTNYVNSSSLTNTLNNYALKTDIPTDYVNSSLLTNTLNDYSTTSECNENYVKTTGDNTINGNILNMNSNIAYASNGIFNITTTGKNTWIQGLDVIATNLNDNGHLLNCVGKAHTVNKLAYFGYLEPGKGVLGLQGFDDIITFQSTSINLNKNTTITGNLTVSGTITGTQSNTTITHYSPIEQSMSSINDFIIGGPIYMSGKVYKQTNEGWQSSTVDDTTDCICSVKAKGKWNEYFGICVDIDENNNCLTFATHGDYLVKVSDTSLYSVGDEIFIDDDNVLKILSGNTAITSKIQRTIIGINNS